MVRLKDPQRSEESEDVKDFNSTMVRLKARAEGFEQRSNFHFNSTMVRLKASDSRLQRAEYLFQFHYGTIKRRRS